MKKNFKNIGFLMALVMVVLIVAGMFETAPKVEKTVYSDLIQEIEEGKVSELVLTDSRVEVTYDNSKSLDISAKAMLKEKDVFKLVGEGVLKVYSLPEDESYREDASYLEFAGYVEDGSVTELVLMDTKVAYTNKSKETRFLNVSSDAVMSNEKVLKRYNDGTLKVLAPVEKDGTVTYIDLAGEIKADNVTELAIMEGKVAYTDKNKEVRFVQMPGEALLSNKAVLTRQKLGKLTVSVVVEDTPDIKKSAYVNLLKEVKEGRIKEIAFKGDKTVVKYKEAEKKIIEAPGRYFLENETVIGLMKADKLKVSTPEPEKASWLISLMPTLITLLILGACWFFMLRQTQGGNKGMSGFGKSKAKSPDENGKRVTFADVAGVEGEKKELSEIVDFLRDPKRFTSLGARIPKGVLLVGPPGTGKTLLAKAVAGEAGVPFFSMSGSDFVEMFVGVGASRVRDLFEQARKNLPAIIFIDEIDAVGRQRGAGLGGGHDEREQTLNQLLVEMDGFGTNSGIIIIAATNRPDILDPALLRPGRFDRQVTVGYPDQKGREAILNIHAQNKPLDETVSLEKVAKSTYGFTGADLENILNEAAIMAARVKKDKIGQSEVDEAILKVVMGPEKKDKVNKEKDKKQTAYHEAGHAILSHILPTQDNVHQVSIIPRGSAGGFTLSLPDTDKAYISKTEMLESIIVLMGGRLAEKIIFDEINTGASSDIDRATTLARKMVMQYGMSDKLGSMTFTSGDHEVFLGRDFSQGNNYSPETAALIDSEVKGIIDYCYNKCEELLRENLEKLHLVAQALIENEKLDSDEFVTAFEGRMTKAATEEGEAIDQ